MKKPAYYILLPCITILTLISCGGKIQYDIPLSNIDSLTEINADSARMLLVNMKPVMKNASDDKKAYYNLLCVKAKDKANIKHTSDSLISEVVKHYEKSDNKEHLPEAYYYLGRVNSDMNNGVKSLFYFQKALQGDGTNISVRLKSRIYAQIGYVYLRNGLFDYATKMQEIACFYCRQCDDTVGMRYCKEDIHAISVLSKNITVDENTKKEISMKIMQLNEKLKVQALVLKNSDLQTEYSRKKKLLWVPALTSITVILISLLSFVYIRRKKKKENFKSLQPQYPIRRHFYDNEVSYILSARIQTGKALKPTDWEIIEARLLEAFPSFKDKLYSLYTLSDIEYRICILIKLEVPPSNMAKLLATSRSSISQNRLRIQKKVFNNRGVAKDWDNYVLSL